MPARSAAFKTAQVPPPPLRFKRRHRKSRNGCLNCKDRRVKCDEKQPSCTTCELRSIECIYQPRQATGVGASIHLDPRAFGDHTDRSTEASQQQSPESSPGQSSKADLQGIVSEKELIQCYLAHVADTFMGSNSRAEQRWIWHVFIPSLAYQSQTVRYGMLTLAAMYMHFALSPTERSQSSKYIDTANSYGTVFVAQSRKELLKLDPSMTDTNMACSRLLGVLALAFHRDYRSSGLRYDDPAAWKWVHLLRGVRAVHDNMVASGQPLDPVLQFDLSRDNPQRGETLSSNAEDVSVEASMVLSYIERTQDDRYEALRSLINCPRAELDQEQQTFCLAALGTLASVTAQVCSMGSRSIFRVLGTWIGRLSPRLVELLECGHHAVLTIYTHWLMLLILTEDLWFIDDMGRAGIQGVLTATASAAPEIVHALRWPREVLMMPRFGKT